VKLEVSASRVIGAPTEKVFDFAVAAENLPRILVGFGPIPGIASIEMLDGAALATGAKRRVRMSDGSEIFEEVTALDRPRRHTYRFELTSPLAAPLAAVVMILFKRWMQRGLERIAPFVTG
jgi:hypothetical protein